MSFPMVARVVKNRPGLCTVFLLSRNFLFATFVCVKDIKILEFFVGGARILCSASNWFRHKQLTKMFVVPRSPLIIWF